MLMGLNSIFGISAREHYSDSTESCLVTTYAVYTPPTPPNSLFVGLDNLFQII